MDKKINSSGQKSYQRSDNEDRSLPYKNWLRTVDADGFFCDIDMVKFRNIDGHIFPVAITELTRCDSETVGQGYLDAIIDRWYNRDNQAEIVFTLANMLNVPAYLVCFQKNMAWLKVFSLRKKEWREFTPQSWLDYLKTL